MVPGDDENYPFYSTTRDYSTSTTEKLYGIDMVIYNNIIVYIVL